MKVCEKVQRKGTTSYNEVADELVSEFSNADNHILPNESVSMWYITHWYCITHFIFVWNGLKCTEMFWEQYKEIFLDPFAGTMPHHLQMFWCTGFGSAFRATFPYRNTLLRGPSYIISTGRFSEDALRVMLAAAAVSLYNTRRVDSALLWVCSGSDILMLICKLSWIIWKFLLHLPQAYDQKNIRRRVYDALNVLMAMNIISKEKKEIKWIGLPTNSAQECQNLEVHR